MQKFVHRACSKVIMNWERKTRSRKTITCNSWKGSREITYREHCTRDIFVYGYIKYIQYTHTNVTVVTVARGKHRILYDKVTEGPK